MECQCWDKQFYKVSNMCNEEASCCTSLFHFHLHKIHLILEMLKSNLYTWDTCEVWRCEVGNSSCEAKTNYMMNKFLNYILLYMLTRSQDCQSIWLVFAHGNSMSCLQKKQDGSLLVMRTNYEPDSFFTLFTLRSPPPAPISPCTAPGIQFSGNYSF